MLKSVLKQLIFIVLLSGVSFFAHAQLLWEISGNKLKHKSYLFGTVHVGDERVIEYAQKTFPYLDNSKIVAGELDLNLGTSFMAMMYIIAPKDSTLSDILSKEQYDEITPFLTEEIGQGEMFINMIRPVFILAMLQEKGQTINIAKEKEVEKKEKFAALDLYIQQRAREQKQKVIGLETVKEQMNAINTSSLREQAHTLYDYVKECMKKEDVNSNDSSMVAQTDNPMENLIQLYLTENIDSLHNQIMGEFPKPLYEAMIVTRNKRMVERMIERMHEKPKRWKGNMLFVAVGAGHLAGTDGMINLLKLAGYTVKPVRLEEEEK